MAFPPGGKHGGWQKKKRSVEFFLDFEMEKGRISGRYFAGFVREGREGLKSSFLSWYRACGAADIGRERNKPRNLKKENSDGAVSLHPTFKKYVGKGTKSAK